MFVSEDKSALFNKKTIKMAIIRLYISLLNMLNKIKLPNLLT
jgi:hypothetical protein